MSQGDPPSSYSRGVFARRLFVALFTILLLPSALFMATSYVQLNRILAKINENPTSHTALLLAPQAFSNDIAAVALELDTISHRHSRSTALLSTRTWMRFMSLIFGVLLMVIGCSFVLGRVTGPAYEGEASFAEVSGSLKSTSPGLFVIAAGVVLVAIPNLSNQIIQTDDSASYFLSGRKGPAVEMPADELSAIKKKHGL